MHAPPPQPRPEDTAFGRGAGEPVIPVSQLVRAAREALERRFPLLWVGGEVSGVRAAASGHLYFVLKDERAQVDCVLYRSRAEALGWRLCDGDRVEILAAVTLYEPRGRFQLVAETARRAGLGPLYERFLRLRDRLAREGLFDEARKRALPAHPRTVGVVTSLEAAALRDVLATLARRDPSIAVAVYPVPVQGEGAAERIAAMLGRASRRRDCEVLLLVRGGGSIEDLWAFNEEVVARAIRACTLPVVVGVGHETDVTIADLAADRRAPTPTAAAELVSPARSERLRHLAHLAARLARETGRRLAYAVQGTDALARRLVHPAARIAAARRELGLLAARLAGSRRHRFASARAHLAESAVRLAHGLARQQAEARARLQTARAALAGLDPIAVLARGYSITRNAAGAVLRDAATVHPGEILVTTLARGQVQSEVRETRADTPL